MYLSTSFASYVCTKFDLWRLLTQIVQIVAFYEEKLCVSNQQSNQAYLAISFVQICLNASKQSFSLLMLR